MKSTLKVLMGAMICGHLWIAPVALAVIETYEFSSPRLELRYHQLSQELRCPKCQNQNIADSNAPIARDLRVVLYEQLEQGATDDEATFNALVINAGKQAPRVPTRSSVVGGAVGAQAGALELTQREGQARDAAYV